MLLPLMLEYIIQPIIGGLIGYSTNWLAIKMLFRPHTEKRLFGIKLPLTPGLIPKEREKLSEKIAQTVSQNVLTPAVLTKELASFKLPEMIQSAAFWSFTVGECLEKAGITDWPARAENQLLNLLRREQTQALLVTVIMAAVRQSLDLVRQGLAKVLSFWEEKGDALWQDPTVYALMEEALTTVRQHFFAEGKTVGAVLPPWLIDALKNTATEHMPKAVAYLRAQTENNPWLDEKLSQVVRDIINENFKLLGPFVDAKKLYGNIKKGLLQYLSEEENQAALLTKLCEALDTLCAFECRQWESHLPDDDYFLGRWTQLVETWPAARIVETVSQWVDGQAFNESIHATLPGFEEWLAEYLREKLQAVFAKENGLPEPLLKGWQDGCRKISAFPLSKLQPYVTEERTAVLQHAVEKIAAFTASRMQIDKMVQDRLNAFTVAEAEALILSVVHRELNIITLLGGLLGFIIGLVSLLTRLG